MPYQFKQTGQEIQDILDQVGINTGNIATNTSDISTINTTLTRSYTTSSSYTNLATYTSSNQYAAPSDGYAFVYNLANVTGLVAIDGHISIGGAAGRYSVFVKKGMSMYVDGTCSYARFVPLV